MDIRNMRQMLAVRRYGSFAKAADALGMSQPALSASIARLEDQLKVRLFDRTSSGSQLTPIGELIADRAGKLVAEVERIVHDAHLVARGEVGTIRLGVGTALRQYFLPLLVSSLARDYPSLDLRIEVLDRDRLLPLLQAGELDVAICSLGEDVAMDELVAVEVLTTDAVAVAHPAHPLLAENTVSIARFAEFPGAGASLRDFANARLLYPRDVPDAVSRYMSNDYEPMLQLAVAGHATLVAPTFIVRAELEAGRLKQINLDWQFRVTFAAIATRAASYSPIISRIVRSAASLGASLQEEVAARPTP